MRFFMPLFMSEPQFFMSFLPVIYDAHELFFTVIYEFFTVIYVRFLQFFYDNFPGKMIKLQFVGNFDLCNYPTANVYIRL